MTTPQPSVTTTFRSTSEEPREQASAPKEPRSQTLDVAMRIAAASCFLTADTLTFVAGTIGALGDRIRSKIPGLKPRSWPWMPYAGATPSDTTEVTRG